MKKVIKCGFSLLLCAIFAFSIPIDSNAVFYDAEFLQPTSETPEVTTYYTSDNILVTVIHNPTVISDGREQHQLSDEILNADTYTLLQHVLNSEYIRIARKSARLLSSNIEPLPTRYFEFNGFAELLERPDLDAVLMSYISTATDWERTILQDMLANSEMANSVAELTRNSILAIDSENGSVYSARSDFIYADTEYGITLSRVGKIPFIDGTSVLVWQASREYTATEQAEVDSNWQQNHSDPTTSLLIPADISYNCHSYAWYLADNSNPYWIQSDELIIPSSVPQISPEDIQEDDIIIYYGASNQIIHSALVTSIGEEGITVKSKWGKAGVYQHNIGSVPPEYKVGNTVIYSIYRYHRYDMHTITDLGHRGARHYYQQTDCCGICSHTETTNINVICSGPPCISPLSIRAFSE